MAPRRAAIATAVLAAAGLGISSNLVYVHSRLATGAGYTSWCAVNSQVNCDIVLASPHAYFLGLPLAWWSLAAYLAIGGGAFGFLASTSAVRRRRVAAALLAAAVWAVLVSLYLFAVSVFAIGALCLLCSGLYVVNLAMLVPTAALYAATRAAARKGAARRTRNRLLTGGVAAGVLAVVAIVGWQLGRGDQLLTPEEIKAKDPGFFAWYSQLPRIAGPISGGHQKGRDDAPVAIVEFSDFECAHCAVAFKNLREVLLRYPQDVQVRFRHFPLDASCNSAVPHTIHRYACLAAAAAECAAAQGRFWEYHDLLFENQANLDRDSLLAYADKAGLERQAFLACLDSEEARQAVARDVAEGRRLGIESTPTLFLNGRTMAGAPRADVLGYAIQVERDAQRRSDGVARP